jgi:hypothetical protein
MTTLNPFKTLDDAIRYGANKAVEAYNWTTGGTKAELANNMYLSGAIIFSASTAGVTAPIFYFVARDQIQRNTELESKEIKAVEQGLKDLSVEKEKLILKTFEGYTYGLAGLVMGAASSLIPKETEIVKYFVRGMGLGFMLMSSSQFVMRADYLPPRKDCVSRGLDKLNELVERYKERRTFLPATVRAR